jgi:hypothetical protein
MQCLLRKETKPTTETDSEAHNPHCTCAPGVKNKQGLWTHYEKNRQLTKREAQVVYSLDRKELDLHSLEHSRIRVSFECSNYNRTTHTENSLHAFSKY